MLKKIKNKIKTAIRKKKKTKVEQKVTEDLVSKKKSSKKRTAKNAPAKKRVPKKKAPKKPASKKRASKKHQIKRSAKIKDPEAKQEAKRYDNPVASRTLLLKAITKEGTMTQSSVFKALKVRADQEEGDRTHGPVVVGLQYGQQSFQLLLIQIILHVVVFLEEVYPSRWVLFEHLPFHGQI